MENGRTFEDLTPEQQEKLADLLGKLGGFPLAEMLVRCVEVEGPDPRIAADRARLDTALAGAMAFDRMLLYLKRMRSLNDERRRLGERIWQLSPKREDEVEAAAQATVMAAHLAGEQEVVHNFLSVSIQHIRSLLKVVAAAVEYEIAPDDLDFLDRFRHLRNHFEH